MEKMQDGLFLRRFYLTPEWVTPVSWIFFHLQLRLNDIVAVVTIIRQVYIV